jgi:ankyrin repeat protein
MDPNGIASMPDSSSVYYDSISDSLADKDYSFIYLAPSSPRLPDCFTSSLPEKAFTIKNLDTGEEIDLRDENKETFSSKARTLLGQDEDYFKLRRKVNESLWEAIEHNDEDQIEYLIDSSKNGNLAAHPNAKGLNDWNALHMAASDGLHRVCAILINKGDHTDIDARTTMNRTPLHLAVLHNHLEVVKVLVLHCADINAVDCEYNTALHYAATQGFVEIVRWLLERGPNIDVYNHLNRTPMDLALNSSVLSVFMSFCASSSLRPIKTGYSRIQVSSTLLHNSREDHINKLLLKASKPPRLTDLQTFNDRPKLAQAFPTKSSNIVLPACNKVGPNDFKAVAQLGKGSFGEVYLVEKKDSGVLYALKVLKKEKIIGSNLIRYAFAERNITLNITHPFIVKLNFAFQTPDKLAMVMDYCPHGDLGMHISREKRFSEAKAKFYACEVLLALEELHRHGIIFRDLKPDNVVLDALGHARLTDFGLSKEGVNEGQLTKSFCGSVAYLAPEMLKRTGHSRSVDWYLFGVLLYEMLVGAPPYYSTSREQLFNNIQRGKLRVPKTVSAAARELIKALLHREPNKRLGAGKKDAEEVKAHAFFKGVEWGQVLRKEVAPPPFKEMKRLFRDISLEKVFAPTQEEERILDGWSVLIPAS